jgi:hypothetical protein
MDMPAVRQRKTSASSPAVNESLAILAISARGRFSPSCYARQQTSKVGASNVSDNPFDHTDPQLCGAKAVAPNVYNAL